MLFLVWVYVKLDKWCFVVMMMFKVGEYNLYLNYSFEVFWKIIKFKRNVVNRKY